MDNNNMEKAIKKELNFTASGKMHDRILRDVLAAQEEPKKTKSAFTWPNIRRIIMKSPITKLAVATMIIIAVPICIYLFGDRVDGTSTAWADVVQNIQECKTVTWKITVLPPDGPPFEFARVSVLEPYYSRYELANGTIILGDRREGKTVSINPGQKTAKIGPPPSRQETAGLYDAFQNFRDMPESPVEQINQQQIDGKQATGFHVFNEHGDHLNVWVDLQTELPIRVEFFSTYEQEQREPLAIWTDIVFGAELDESLFKFDLEGYEVEELDSYRRGDYDASDSISNVVVPEESK